MAERRVERVVDLLTKYGHDYFFTSLSEASRRLQTTDVPVFINILDSFNAPQFSWRWLGTDRVSSDGYLLLEKGGAVDYTYSDDYYKQFTALVRLSAGTKNMMTRALWGSVCAISATLPVAMCHSVSLESSVALPTTCKSSRSR
jgi:hypothetical protein